MDLIASFSSQKVERFNFLSFGDLRETADCSSFLTQVPFALLLV